ncbi:hypothetical protein M422DRAFT_262359 [Sphaerobolus stellatus SS14]|uniref:SCP domain-containing protein n=1 Tax=Sphaerobolus stellatus (strain SS14) TaxID=990650 RepID=A0A0C9V1A6_SPHS4|nr:hypothetical protein M422DRAFT_262359 [Sphaerobolus stellatus SS14]
MFSTSTVLRSLSRLFSNPKAMQRVLQWLLLLSARYCVTLSPSTGTSRLLRLQSSCQTGQSCQQMVKSAMGSWRRVSTLVIPSPKPTTIYIPKPSLATPPKPIIEPAPVNNLPWQANPAPIPHLAPPPLPAKPSSSSSAPKLNAVVQAYLDAHNNTCDAHDAAPLAWSNSLAYAQTWANRCVMQHSGRSLRPYGENLAWGPPGFKPTDAVNLWNSEKSK